MIVKIVKARADTNQLAVVYQAYMVLYQCGSIDIVHNQINAALENGGQRTAIIGFYREFDDLPGETPRQEGDNYFVIADPSSELLREMGFQF